MRHQAALLSASLLLCMGASGAKSAPAAEAGAQDLRICAAQNEPPFSMKDGSGFENRIGVALAEGMGRKPVFVWSEKPAIYLVRDYLDKNRCDVVIGLDKGDDRVLASAPYYRSAYVFITRADQNLDVRSWSDPRIAGLGHVVVGFGTPGEQMLKEKGLYEDNMAYLYSLVNFKAPRNQYTQIPPERIVDEVASGRAGLGVGFAPEVARYVAASTVPLRMTVIDDDVKRSDGRATPMHFDQSVGVRKDDPALLKQVDEGLVKARGQIAAILKQEGVAVLDKGM
ncbi:methanol oxidation system protein MoxJ [Methylocella sp.]|uniref:methanol oxidation system protein MoxJ n=1 Tax=Methylocella sp. TaxID=1978226 RepID=UPI003784E3CD